MPLARKRRTGGSASIRVEKAAEIPVGVVGLGLMGNSIMACLLAAGHPVVGVTRSLSKRRNTRRHLQFLLRTASSPLEALQHPHIGILDNGVYGQVPAVG